MPENETDQNIEVKDDVQTDDQDKETKDTETVDTETKDDKTKDDETKETNETRVGVIDRIKNIIKGKADDIADVDSKEGTDIPDEFTEAAIKAGWTEKEIEEWTSDYTDDELREYAEDLILPSEDSDKSEQLSKKEGDTQQKVEKKDNKVKDDEKDSEAKDEEIRLLKERLDKVEKGQKKSTDREAEDKLISMASRATKLMDEQSKKFEIFGIYEGGKPNSMPRFPDGRVVPSSPQMKARNEVWGLALSLEKTGMDFDTALSTSLNAFKGKNLAKDVKRNLIKDLKKSEKRLSAKHSSHEQVKTGLSGVDVIKEVQKKHGLDTS